MHSTVGKRSPAHCSSLGKVLLAGMPASEVEALYSKTRLEARTPHTLTRRKDLIASLAQIRAHGYATDREELEPGLCCAAAPVFDRTGSVVAALSVSGPTSRLHDATLAGVTAEVVAAAAQASARLGAPRAIADWPRPATDDARVSDTDSHNRLR